MANIVLFNTRVYSTEPIIIPATDSYFGLCTLLLIQNELKFELVKRYNLCVAFSV